MNRHKRLVIGGLLTLAIVLGVVTLRAFMREAPTTAHPASAREVRAGITSPAHAKPDRTQDTTRTRTSLKRGPAAKASEGSGSETAPVTGNTSASEAKTPREQAVEAWERQIDDVMARTNVPAKEHAGRVKATFDKLDKEDQMDGVRRALNLLPDGQFPVLYDILYDKAEDPDVLDAIFSDALNRAEEIKNPLMKDLRKDPTHPMFFESARILDVVEPAEATP